MSVSDSFRCKECGQTIRKLTNKELSEIRRQNAIKTLGKRKRSGRSKIFDWNLALLLYKNGMSKRAIAKKLKVSRTSIQNALKDIA